MSPLPTKQNLSSDIAVLLSQMADIKGDVKEIKQKLENEYATKEWVEAYIGQTKKIVNGIVVIIVTAVFTALVALVVKR